MPQPGPPAWSTPPARGVPAPPPPPGGPIPQYAFDPVTGDWIAPGPPSYDPEAPRWGPFAIVMTVILALDLGLLAVDALLSGLAPFLYPELASRLRSAITPETLWLNVAIGMFAFGLIPLLWVVATRQGGWHGVWHYLKLERPLAGVGWGLVAGLATFFGVALLGLVAQQLGVPTENPQLEGIQNAIDWPLAVALALSAGIGEEILFRGVLQRWVGVWGQAALFAVMHASYGTILQVVAPFLIGLAYGILVKRGARLWVVITAHAAFNFAVFALARLDPTGP